MSLISSSTINKITGKDNLTRGNDIIPISSLLKSPNTQTTTDTQSGNGALLSGVGSTIRGATGAVGDAVSGAESYVSGMAENGIKYATSFLNDGINALQSSIGSISDGVSKELSGLFGSSSDNKAASMDKKTPDPLQTSTVKGTPQSKAFTLSNQYSQSTAVDLQGKQSAISTGASSLSTLTSRLGASITSTKSSVLNLASSLTHNSLVNGLYNDVQSAVDTISGTYNEVQSDVSQVTGAISSTVQDFSRQYNGLLESLGGTQSSLLGILQNGLPTTADINGQPIKGIPSNVASSQLDALYGAAKSIGCIVNKPNYTAYGAKSAAKNLLLGTTSELGNTDLLRQLTQCSAYGDSFSLKALSTIFFRKVSTRPNVALVASQAINDPTQTPVSIPLAKRVVTNPNLTQNDVGDIKQIFSDMHVDAQSVYGLDTGGKTPVLDMDTLSASPDYLTNALLNDTSISDVLGGSVIRTA